MLSHFTKLNGHLSKIYICDNKFYWMDHVVPSCFSLTERNRGIVVQCQRPTGSIGESRKPPHSSPFHSVPRWRTGKTAYWVKTLSKFVWGHLIQNCMYMCLICWQLQYLGILRAHFFRVVRQLNVPCDLPYR